jgi:hypothetical protein
MAPLLVAFGMQAGTAATVMTYAGTAVAAAGAIQQGRVAEAQGRSAQTIASYNALVQEREARAIEQKAKFDQMRQAEAAARVKSQLRAKMAGTGTLPDVGTNLLFQGEQAAELELENFLIGYEGEIGAGRARSQAEIDRLQGKIYRQKGKAGRRASYINAGSTLLTGFGSTQ